MSKADRNPPREAAPTPKPAPREREQAPPIFWGANDDEPKVLNAPIYLVYVYGFDKTGERIPLDTTTLDGLPTHAHELGAKYDTSPIELVARGENGAVLCRVTHRTKVAPAAPAIPATPAPAPAPATPAMDPLSLMLAMNERTDKLLGLLIQSKDAASAQIIDAISKMSGARLTDSQELFQTILKAKQATAAAPSSAGELAAFKSGMAFFEKLVDAGREAEAGGDDDTLSKLESMMNMFERVSGTGKGPQQRVVDTSGVPKQ